MFGEKNTGVAFLLLLGILAVAVVLVIGLLVILKFEGRQASNFNYNVQATYITEAGFEHAKSLLKKDKLTTIIDDYSESWHSTFEGSDVDNDGDGLNDSKWIDFFDISGNLTGRYAVLVKDENSKININTAGLSQDKGLTTEEISLVKFLQALNEFVYPDKPLTDLETKAQAIYQNRPYLALSQMKNLKEIDAQTFQKLKNFSSIYAADSNTAVSGELKFCLNELSKDELYELFRANSIDNAAQLAVNTVDFYDTNLNQSSITEGEKTFYGQEALKINEIMVKPAFFTEVEDEGPKGYWIFVDDHYQTDKFGASMSWQWHGIRNGVYYLRVFAVEEGQIVGDITVGEQVQKSMMHGELLDNPITIDNGTLTIEIQNNEEAQDGNPVTCYFKSVKLSQEPDGEFIELVNMSNQAIDLSSFTVSGSGLSDEIGLLKIPEGVEIGAKEFLVLAIDAFDEQKGIKNNQISFRDIWNKEFGVVDMEIDRQIAPDFDCILNEGGELFLKDAKGYIIDRVEFLDTQVQNYVSLEKDDPTYFEDVNGNSICDLWNLSLDVNGATPGEENINANMGAKSVFDINFKNGSFERVGEILDVPSSLDRWKSFPFDSAANIIDKICIESIKCEAKGHLLEGEGWFLEGEEYKSQQVLDKGKWRWQVPNGLYLPTIYGEENETLSVSVDNENFFELVPDDKGRISFGMIEITTGILDLFLINNSPSQIAHFKYAVLSPKLKIDGKVNINTATKPLLLALPGIDEEVAERIINDRPFGNQNELKRGIGDLLDSDILDSDETKKKEKFKQISNLTTTKSDVFEIIVTGQRLLKGKVVAEKKLRTVFER
jgi:DNA uptake protein ComE-like DNA-binding protein